MNFDQYYKKEIEPLIKDFEAYRLALLSKYRRNKIILFLSITSYIIFLYFFNIDLFSDAYKNFIYPYFHAKNNYNLLLPVSFIFIIFCAWILKINSNILANFQFKIKNQLYKKILAFYPQLEYQPNGGIDIEIIRDSYLFPNFNQFYIKDYIIGNYKNINLELSEVKLENITQEAIYENGKWITQTEVKEVFKGIFCILDFDKNFTSTIYVVPNKLMKIFNNLPSNLERVKLEDPSFEKIFDVYGDSQIDSRYVLTPALMERLVKLNEMRKFSCYFHDKQVFLALAGDKGFLPELVLNKEIDYERVKNVIEDIRLIFDIIDIYT